MKPLKINLNDLKEQHLNAFNDISNDLNPNHLDFFYYENTVWAYPKSEYLFQLGIWSMSYTNNSWAKTYK